MHFALRLPTNTTARLHLGGSAETSFHVSSEIMLSSGSGLAHLGDERLTGWKLASSAEAPVSASVSSVVLQDRCGGLGNCVRSEVPHDVQQPSILAATSSVSCAFVLLHDH